MTNSGRTYELLFPTIVQATMIDERAALSIAGGICLDLDFVRNITPRERGYLKNPDKWAL